MVSVTDAGNPRAVVPAAQVVPPTGEAGNRRTAVSTVTVNTDFTASITVTIVSDHIITAVSSWVL